MRIYLSHSKRDYGSEHIRDVKARIVRIYGEDTEVVDPSKYADQCIDEEDRGGFFLNMMDIFFPLIDECEVLVAVPDKEMGSYTGGVITEMRYAKRHGIGVWEL